MATEVLKHTKSLSPLTLKEIDAEIIFDGDNVCMVKKDEEGSEYKALIEKDKELYLLFAGLTDDYSAETQFVSAYVSSKCNLTCHACYERSGDDKEISLEEIKALSAKYKNCNLGLTGMEPTCREDIFELIKATGGKVWLVTNGIKLASLEYVKKLKAHGLKRIFFSFNGTNDEVYQKINRGNLLETKLKALENIKLEKINAVLSATIARGVNEDQILPLVEFCFKHRSFIVELRIRTLAPIGKHLNTEQILLSELIQLVADSLNIDKKDILTEFKFIQLFIKDYSRLLPKGFRDKYGAKLCSLTLHVKKEKNGRYSSPGARIDLDKINKSILKSVRMFYYLVKAYGAMLLIEIALYASNFPRLVFQKNILNIVLKCWPNIYNIDLKEMDKCPRVYYRNGQMEKFCVSNIINSIKKERQSENL
ncbi:MAG: radical SAM protein [Syntrophaceae bacterium]|nr:radical SAM protein [Syntrophaceae bacterium]